VLKCTLVQIYTRTESLQASNTIHFDLCQGSLDCKNLEIIKKLNTQPVDKFIKINTDLAGKTTFFEFPAL